MLLELDSLRKAVSSLAGIVSLTGDAERMARFDDVARNGLKAGAVQNFEFTYELCWKFMKRWLEHNLGAAYVDGAPRRELFRLAAEHRLIDDPQKWMDYHRARNLTSHTYNEETAEDVFAVASGFAAAAKDLLSRLESRND
jgi:nucleotidyltransferase substrate binding protein (TIGR01987 family)